MRARIFAQPEGSRARRSEPFHPPATAHLRLNDGKPGTWPGFLVFEVLLQLPLPGLVGQAAAEGDLHL